MTDDYVDRLRAYSEDPSWSLKLRADLRAAVAELDRLRKDVAKLNERVAPVDDRELMSVNDAAEALYAYAEQRSTQSQFGNQLRAVLDSRQSWRYRAFKLEDDVEQSRAERAALGDAEHQWRIVTPSGPVHSFTQRDLDDRANWLPGVRLEQRTVYGTRWEPAEDPPCTDHGDGWKSRRPTLSDFQGPFTGLLGSFGTGDAGEPT